MRSLVGFVAVWVVGLPLGVVGFVAFVRVADWIADRCPWSKVRWKRELLAAMRAETVVLAAELIVAEEQKRCDQENAA